MINLLQVANGDTPMNRRAMMRNMILTDDASVRFYTGLPTKGYLEIIYQVIMKRVGKICYWRGEKSTNDTYLKKGSGGKAKIIDHYDEYLLTLMFLRRGITMKFLGDLFGVSRTSVTCIIHTWVNVLYQILKHWLIWPSAERVKEALPKSYPAKYADTRVILDCTEIFHTKPKNCSAQSSTYSQYKHHNTVKVMVGITPRGLITFVSNPYGGNTSDRHIAEKEILHKLEPGDAVMVDRGFNIKDLLLQRGVKLHMPPFTRKNREGTGKTLNQKEILQTREIASLRIHVERAIERMKNFRILSNTINFNLWSLFYQILVIVSVFCNLDPPLLKD